MKQAASDIKRLTDSCRQTYFALPDEFKTQARHVGAVGLVRGHVPEPARPRGARRRGARASTPPGGNSKAAQDEAKKVETLRAKLDSARDRLRSAKRGLPGGDAAALRQEYAAKQGDEKGVTASLAAGKKEITATETEIDRYQRALGENDRELTEIAGKLNLEESSRKQSAEAIERAKKTLPATWQKPLESAGLNDRAKWQDELDALVGKGTEAKYTQLQAARGGLDPLRAEITQLEAEADTFAGRRTPLAGRRARRGDRRAQRTRRTEQGVARRAGAQAHPRRLPAAAARPRRAVQGGGRGTQPAQDAGGTARPRPAPAPPRAPGRAADRGLRERRARPPERRATVPAAGGSGGGHGQGAGPGVREPRRRAGRRSTWRS